MNHPIVQNTWRLSFYTAIWVLSGLLYAAVMLPLVQVPLVWLFSDGLVSFLLYGLLMLPLWVVVRYASYLHEPFYQKIFAYATFCALLLVVWLALITFFLYSFFPREIFLNLIPSTLPIKAFFGILYYVSFVLIYRKLNENELKEEEEQREDTIIEALEEDVKETSTDVEMIERITVKVGKKIHLISVSDIYYLQSEGDYVMIYAADGHYLKEQTMKYFEEHLPSTKFVRIHRSCIVNVEIISRVELYEKQNYLITLQNGQQLKASLSGYKLLRKTLSL
jgi:hypothetical protein